MPGVGEGPEELRDEGPSVGADREASLRRFDAVTIAECDRDTRRAISRMDGGFSGDMSRATAQETAAVPEIGLGGGPAVWRWSVEMSASMCTPFARRTTWPRRSSQPHPLSRNASRAGPVIRSPTTT